MQLHEIVTENGCLDRGVRQGCSLSPTLFNIYPEFLITEVLEGIGNFKIEGTIIRIRKYADAQVLITNNNKELQIIINHLVEIGKMYGMEINTEKFKAMRINRNSKLISRNSKTIKVKRLT